MSVSRISTAFTFTSTIVLGVATFSAVAMTGKANAAGFEILRPHRAIYEIKLKDATERSGIVNMNGRIVYEMSGNECEGMSVKYRFVSRVNANGDIFTTDQQTASFESPDGNQYNFLTKSYVDKRLERTVKGVAKHGDGGTLVKLDSPEKRELELPDASFISTHLVKMLEKAREGVPFFKLPVFDGGDGADEVLKTTNVIGKPDLVATVLEGEKAEAVAELKDEKSWPVTIGYFNNLISDSTEGMPVYQVSFLLYEGGISRKLVMSYPDYSLTGALVSLELLKQEACTLEN